MVKIIVFVMLAFPVFATNELVKEDEYKAMIKTLAFQNPETMKIKTRGKDLLVAAKYEGQDLMKSHFDLSWRLDQYRPVFVTFRNISKNTLIVYTQDLKYIKNYDVYSSVSPMEMALAAKSAFIFMGNEEGQFTEEALHRKMLKPVLLRPGEASHGISFLASKNLSKKGLPSHLALPVRNVENLNFYYLKAKIVP